MASYQELVVWQKGIELVVAVYEVTKAYPQSELYGLASQTRRSAVSIPANIAEGRARGTTREFHRFVGMALGSTAELETHVLIAERLGYVEARQAELLLQQTAQLSRMIGSLKRSLAAKLKNQKSNPIP